MKKKFTALFFSLLAAVLFTACKADYSHIEGYDDIVKARELYSELFSAHLTVTDKQTDTLTQELTFIYNSQNLSYSYFGTDGKTEYNEYYNDTQYSYTSDGKWLTIKSGEENYPVYSKSSRMSMTDEGMIFLKGESVTEATVTNTDGGKTVKFVYDAAALNASMANQLGLVGELKSFEVIYTLDKDGYCTSMEQIGVAEKDDAESKVDYLLEIDLMNDVGEIEKPEGLENAAQDDTESRTENE